MNHQDRDPGGEDSAISFGPPVATTIRFSPSHAEHFANLEARIANLEARIAKIEHARVDVLLNQ